MSFSLVGSNRPCVDRTYVNLAKAIALSFGLTLLSAAGAWGAPAHDATSTVKVSYQAFHLKGEQGAHAVAAHNGAQVHTNGSGLAISWPSEKHESPLVELFNVHHVSFENTKGLLFSFNNLSKAILELRVACTDDKGNVWNGNLQLGEGQSDVQLNALSGSAASELDWKNISSIAISANQGSGSANFELKSINLEMPQEAIQSAVYAPGSLAMALNNPQNGSSSIGNGPTVSQSAVQGNEALSNGNQGLSFTQDSMPGLNTGSKTKSAGKGGAFSHFTTPTDYSNFTTALEQGTNAFTAYGGTQYGVTAGQLQINFPVVAAGKTALMVANNVNNVNFTNMGATAFTLTNPMSTPVSISVYAMDTNNQNWHANIVLPPNSTQNYCFLNGVGQNGTSFGMQAIPNFYPGYSNFFSSGSSTINWASIASVQFYSMGPQPAQTVNVNDIAVLPAVNLLQLLTGSANRWGQSTVNTSENQVTSDNSFAQENAAEQAQLSQEANVGNLDSYGGSTTLPAQTATGNWQLKQVNGKWWFVDPLGSLYFMSGVDQVDPSVAFTTVTNRGYMFGSLPSSTDPLAANYGTASVNGQSVQTYNFYTQNLQLKYGTSSWKQPWMATTVKRFQKWGFNSFGSYSEWQVNNTNTLPYLASLSLTGSYDTISTGNNTSARPVPDPWDPQFLTTLQSNMSLLMGTMKNDKMLVGLFSGIELGWTGPDGPNANMGLAFGVMNTPANEPAHVQLVNYLTSEYHFIRNLNIMWGTSFSSFQAVNFAVNYSGNVTPQMQQDLTVFESQYAAKFFSTVNGVIKAYNPNMLYLGTEIGHYCPAVMMGAVGNVDAMCINRYAAQIPTDVLADATTYNVPMLITEWDFGTTQSGMWGGGLAAQPTEAARDTAAASYLNQAISNPMVVGANWYQYFDEPLLGSMYGYPAGENFNEGLVDQGDTPYSPLIAAFQQVHEGMYSSRWNN